jgi:mannosyltransferase
MAAGQGGKTSAPPAGPGAADAAAGPGAAPSRWTAMAVRFGPPGLAAATMAVLGAWGLARQGSMGNDEVATRWAALLPLHGLAHLVNNVDAVHGLYYLIMHIWVVLGSSPAVLRIPSLLAMIGAVALTAIIGRRLTGSAWAGLLAGLVMALTPVISFYAQTARSYALVVTSVLGATLVLLHALQAEADGRPVARWWLGYAALIVLGGYLNEMALLILAAHAVTVLLSRYGVNAFAHWLIASVVGAALVGPLAIVSSREDRAVGWIDPPTVADVRTLFHDYFGPITAIAILLVVCAVVALLPARGSAWRSQRGVSMASVAAPLLILPALLLILESIVAHPLYVDRYVLYGEAGAALLAGAGLYRIGQWLAGALRPAPADGATPGDAAGQGTSAGRRALIWVPGIVACVCVLAVQFGAQQRARTPESRLFDFGGPSRYIGAHARPGDGVLFFGKFFRKARLGYPGDFRDTRDLAMAVSPTQAGNFQGMEKPFPQVRPLLLATRRIWVVGLPPGPERGPGLLGDESAVLQSQFSLVTQQHFRGITLTLWQRR